MFKKPHRHAVLTLAPDEGTAPFAGADVLFAMEWSSVAPGFGGWEVLIDNEQETRLVSVVPPGSDAATFFIFRKGQEVRVVWRSPTGEGAVLDVGSCASLRAAVLMLCPIPDELLVSINEAMEALSPRRR